MTLSSPVDADQLRDSLLRFIEERVRLELLTASKDSSRAHPTSPRLEISHMAPQWGTTARQGQGQPDAARRRGHGESRVGAQGGSARGEAGAGLGGLPFSPIEMEVSAAASAAFGSSPPKEPVGALGSSGTCAHGRPPLPLPARTQGAGS